MRDSKEFPPGFISCLNIDCLVFLIIKPSNISGILRRHTDFFHLNPKAVRYFYSINNWLGYTELIKYAQRLTSYLVVIDGFSHMPQVYTP